MPDPGSLILHRDLLDSDFAESYRSLWANIAFSGATETEQVKTFVVTSAGAREGKTTTALNLAIVMAHAGRAAVVVDAGAGRPGAYDLLCSTYGWDLPDWEAPGLSGAVAGTVEPESAVLTTPLRGLFVVPRGPGSRNPSELLSSERMRSVLDTLSGRADYVLVDAPPCVGCSGSWFVSRAVDGVLYVVRAGSERTAQREALRQLRLARARVLGVVFNDVDRGRAERGDRARARWPDRGPWGPPQPRLARSQW
ncbi:MAG TPA: CpsD/CapB family tyrosine-protein kinase [Candidatus Eisenbacteria bacterium]|nr:CpsD/CapB family tyrosine-protein kinase [Candidatus Eisenbacteria bacterium]